MLELLQQIKEITVPRPNMVVQDISTKEYGKVGYFKWRGGEATTIPVTMDSGKTDRLTYFTFPRRYSIIDPASTEYRYYKEVQNIDRQLAELDKELHNIEVTIRSDQANLKILPSYARAAMASRIGKLETERDKLRREVLALKKHKEELIK